jgi:RNA polymerase sigma-70 factor, ECF subfamily
VPTEGLDALAHAAAGGDHAALDELLRQIQPRVMTVCSRMLPYRQDAEEASQDALLQIATKIGTFRQNARFTTWAHAVATNSARMTYRKLRTHAERHADALPSAEPADPRRTSVIAGTRLDLLDALDLLEREDPDLVPPLVLRDLGGLSYQEIVDHLGVSMENVKGRIHRARRRVRASLER